MLQLAREDRRRAIRYTAGGAAFIGALVALYHATSQRGPSAVAGLLAPAAIMVLYLLWVLYSTRKGARASRLAAAAAESNNQAAAAAVATDSTTAAEETSVSLSLEPRPLERAQSKLTLNSNGPINMEAGRSLNTLPNRLRSSNVALHHSTESLHRASSQSAIKHLSSTSNQSPLAPVHRSTLNLTTQGSRGGQRGLASQRHSSRMMRSTLQLNNTRQVAAAAANLPSYEEATNRNHWLLTHNHSRERLLRQ